MHNPDEVLISVVVPARDAAAWIEELLESVLAQGVQKSEVIVVDNGSVDGTPELVRRVAEADSRVSLIRSDATSAAAARNEGVALANGTFLAFADSDDLVPDGAYAALLDSLQNSGSDMAIGDHLKFSPTATWQPTARWGSFQLAQAAVAPAAVPGLLATRACWNRLFRRSFWISADLRFPEIPSLEDIEPMTKALALAESVDVVPTVVYLYRDRGMTGSISKQFDAQATIRYLEEETKCLALLAARPELRDQLALVVLDADGWVHLSRFLEQRPSKDDLEKVEFAMSALLRALPLDHLGETAPERHALWSLVLARDWGAASAFATRIRSDDPVERLRAWLVAVEGLRASQTDSLDLPTPVASGVLRALVNDADSVPRELLVVLAMELSGRIPNEQWPPGLMTAMRDAVLDQDAQTIAAVSSIRRAVPFVVNSVDVEEDLVRLAGGVSDARLLVGLSLVVESSQSDDRVALSISTTGGEWAARLHADALEPGRWHFLAKWDGVRETFPVVTARMPLPPLPTNSRMQPLADRRDSWRFIVERRAGPKNTLAAIFDRLRRAFRS